MAFGDYATLRDDFNYFDCGVSGTNKWSPKIHTSASGVGCINNNYTGSDSNFVSGHYKISTPAADFEAYASIQNMAFGRHCYLFGRLRDVETTTPDGYYVDHYGGGDGSHTDTYRWDDGAGTLIGPAYTAGHFNIIKFGIYIHGSTIESWVYSDGADTNPVGWYQAATVTDSTYATAGPCGVGVQGSSFNVAVDDFFMGDIPTPSTDVLSMQPHISGHSVW